MNKIKKLYYSFLKAFFADVPTSLYRLLLFGLVVYSILPLFLYPDIIFYKVYYYLAYFVLGILIICALAYFPLKTYLRNYYIKIQTKSSKGKNRKHLAIILVRYNIIYKTFFYVLIHFKKFFTILNQNKISYVVYVIDTKEEFIDIVKDKNVKALFIFGHGRKHGLKFGNELWPYYNIPKVKNIKYVGQFHCNHESGKTLYEHLGCKGMHIEGVTLSYDINNYINSKKYVSILKNIFDWKN